MSQGSMKGRKWQEYVHRFLAANPRCHLCGELIDPTFRSPHPLSGSVDHLVPMSVGGSRWDPANHRAAHRVCNLKRGAKCSVPVGATSRAW